MGSNTSSSVKSYGTSSVHSLYSSFVFRPPSLDLKNYDHSIYDKIIRIKSSNDMEISLTINKYENSNKYIIFSHGNAADILSVDNFCKSLSEKLKINVVLYDYQGYGFSTGKPCEQNCYDDLYSVIEYVKLYKPTNIFLIGQSLGTGIVVDYVSKYKWKDPVMLISPYESIISVVNNSFNSITQYIDMFDTKNKISCATCPILIIHGEQDKLININDSKRLYKKIKNKINPIWIEDAGHNDILSFITDEMFEKLLNH